MNKRAIVIILAVIFLLALSATGLYYGLKNQKDDVVEQETVETINKISDEEVISPIPSFDGNAIWYFNRQGKLFRVSTQGDSLTEFPLPPLQSIDQVYWPKTGNDFIATSSTAGSEKKYFYNANDKKYYALPSNIQNFDWLPDGKRIVYIWLSGDGQQQQLAIANADSTGFNILTSSIFWPDFKLYASPSGDRALMVRPKIEGEVNKIYIADLKNGQIQIAVNEGKNSSAMWLASGDKFLFSQLNTASAYPKIYMYNLGNNQQTDLNLNTTLEKVWLGPDGKTLYAAVPKPDNSGDEFIRMDLNTYAQETYFSPEQSVRARHLQMISGRLYYVDSVDNKLYSITK